MPSGITADIYEGKDITVHQYMERVARSMTDFIHQRDYNGPLTRRNLAGIYKEKADQAEKALKNFNSLGKEELSALHAKERQEYIESRKKRIEDNSKLFERYLNMVDQVKALDVPEELEYARGHALKYLEDSIDHDIDDYEDDSIERMIGYHVDEDYVKWVKNKRKILTKNLSRSLSDYAENLERDAEFNQKIDLWSTLVGYEIKDAE